MPHDTEHKSVGWGVWSAWVLATTIGEAAAWFVREASRFEGKPSGWDLFVVGICVALAQWLVLRRHMPVARWFALATGIGLVVGWNAAVHLVDYGDAESAATVGAITGMLVGAGQWVTMQRGAARFSDLLGTPTPIARAVLEKQWIAPRLLWPVATALGLAVGLAAPEILSSAFSSSATRRLMYYLGFRYDSEISTVKSMLDTITIGASVGLAQWLVIRRRIPEAKWWVLATIAGVAVGFSMVRQEGFYQRSAIVALGASVGLAQWAVLRRHISEVCWWTVATALGFALGDFLDFKLPANFTSMPPLEMPCSRP